MRYDEALRLWGKGKIEDDEGRYGKRPDIDPASVVVSMDFNAGYACCGGSDPDCYCSYAESPSATVKISGESRDLRHYSTEIDADSFDFASVLGEILDVGGGVIDK
ncbi:hypothetical protein [Micromonospora sp. GCM10011541]|uniref:hypothetical protein n=1 Tax=Micromonospora sp. GCM10011541 TaxID=3317336 RepID=UPI00361F90E3